MSGGTAPKLPVPTAAGWHDESMEPVAGSLLVAAPSMGDPNFTRTIVLLLDAGHDGALGVVLNRPTDLEVADVLQSWAEFVSGPDVLFSGGPVETDSALALAWVEDDDEPVGWRRVAGSTGLVDLDVPVEILAAAVSSLRIFAGYSGWSSGQLWYVVPAQPQDPFAEDPTGLWSSVLRRQGGQLAMLATMPSEPTLN
jgi:putative transcriptional regulator